MILADKIMNLRKKAGWSQEELASQLGVTRQSVSKWEGAQSVPDLDKVVQMSRIFEVSTDYLLKDELEEPEIASGEIISPASIPMRRVSMEEAAEFLKLRREAAPKIAVGTFLCIISPVCLLLLGILSEYSVFGISENMAGGAGLCILLILVAGGIVLFLSCAGKAKPFEYLEKEIFETEYGVIGMVNERKREFQSTYYSLNILGTVLCILSVIPLFIAMGMDSEVVAEISVCLILFVVGLGCIALIYGGVIEASMDKLLQEGDYTRAEKERKHILGPVSAIYWLMATALFFWYTYGPNGNGHPRYSWFIWVIAGILYGVLVVIVKLIEQLMKK